LVFLFLPSFSPSFPSSVCSFLAVTIFSFAYVESSCSFKLGISQSTILSLSFSAKPSPWKSRPFTIPYHTLSSIHIIPRLSISDILLKLILLSLARVINLKSSGQSPWFVWFLRIGHVYLSSFLMLFFLLLKKTWSCTCTVTLPAYTLLGDLICACDFSLTYCVRF
jgi:hypothetical protein